MDFRGIIWGFLCVAAPGPFWVFLVAGGYRVAGRRGSGVGVGI